MGLLMSLLNDTAAGFPQHKEHEDASYTLDGTYHYSCRIPSGITQPGLGQGQRALHGVVKTRRLGASEAILDTGYLRLLVLIVTVSSECWDQIKSSICIVETKYDCPSLTSSMKPRSRA